MRNKGRKPIGTERPASSAELQELRDILANEDYAAFGARLSILVREIGVGYVARRSGLRRESFYKFFANGKIPRINTMMKIAEAIGLQMTTEQKKNITQYFSKKPYELEEPLAKRLEQAKAFGQEGKYDESEKVYDDILLCYPDCWEAKSGKGSVALARGHCSKGEEIFRQLLDEYSSGPDGQPKNAEACSIVLINLGAIESQKAADPFGEDSLQKRILYYRLAVDYSPNPFAIGLLCMNLIFWGRPELAGRYYRDAGQEMYEEIRKSIMVAFKSLSLITPDLALRLFNWLSEQSE